MRPNTFDVIQGYKKINFFKLGKIWIFKHFFDNKETIQSSG